MQATSNDSSTLLQKIISGGQTGVDQAALDVAIELGIPHGGCCPRGRLSESGPIPAKYQLEECESENYAVRTEANVVLSDATLILTLGELDRGTEQTVELCKSHLKPVLVLNIAAPSGENQFGNWMRTHQIHRLNVAGPRESNRPGIHAAATAFLRRLLVTFYKSPDEI